MEAGPSPLRTRGPASPSFASTRAPFGPDGWEGKGRAAEDDAGRRDDSDVRGRKRVGLIEGASSSTIESTSTAEALARLLLPLHRPSKLDCLHSPMLGDDVDAVSEPPSDCDEAAVDELDMLEIVKPGEGRSEGA